MVDILVLHGPNLNLLGTREPDTYGNRTLADINDDLTRYARSRNAGISILQSNAEHELVDRIQASMLDGTDFIVINPGAFTHTSIAIRDALLGVAVPFIEIHLSNVHGREEFRRHSWLSDIAVGVIVGLGDQGYMLALQAAIDRVAQD